MLIGVALGPACRPHPDIHLGEWILDREPAQPQRQHAHAAVGIARQCDGDSASKLVIAQRKRLKG